MKKFQVKLLKTTTDVAARKKPNENHLKLDNCQLNRISVDTLGLFATWPEFWAIGLSFFGCILNFTFLIMWPPRPLHPCGWVILAHSATFLLCWNFFMQIRFYQFKLNASYIFRYLSNFAVTFHNFLVVTTQANMFRYLFDFPKTFYNFSVKTM